ncbi:MAG: signal recognition particle receptor subunit alpha, partial [Macrococcus canis]
MSFFKKLKNKFVGNNEESMDALETLAPEDTLDPQQEDPIHDVQTNESVSHAEVIEQPKKKEKKSDWDWDFDDDLISIEEFEELEAQQIGAKFREGLEKSRENFQNKLNDLLAMYRTVDEDFFEALEEMLIQADVGFNTVMDLVESLRMEAKRRNITETADLREVIVEKIVEIYEQEDDKLQEMNIQEDGLTVI